MIPESVQVGPYVYTIIADAVRMAECEKESREELFGMTLHKSLEIIIQPDAADTVIRETLLHEVLHAVLYNTGISDRMTEKTEEHLIRALSPALFVLLRDNKKFLGYIVGSDE